MQRRSHVVTFTASPLQPGIEQWNATPPGAVVVEHGTTDAAGKQLYFDAPAEVLSPQASGVGPALTVPARTRPTAPLFRLRSNERPDNFADSLPPMSDPHVPGIDGGHEHRSTKLSNEHTRIVQPLGPGTAAPRLSMHAAETLLIIPTDAASKSDIGITINNGYTNLGANVQMPGAPGHGTLGVFGSAWGRAPGGGINYTVEDPFGLGRHKFEIVGSSKYNARPLGEVTGASAEAIAKAMGLERTASGKAPSLWRMEYLQETVDGLSLNSNFGSLGFCGVRLDLAKSHKIVYRTTRLKKDAQSDWKRAVKNPGVGFVGPRRPLPPLNRPDQLLLDDEFQIQYSGRFYAALAGGVGGMCLGGQGLVRGDLEVAGHKIGKNLVKVTLTPSNIQGFRVFGGVAPGMQLAFGKYNARVLRQVFIFDTSKPTGLAEYYNTVRGKPPCRLQDVPRCGAGMKAEVQWNRLIKDENKLLPAGVQRVCLQMIESPQQRMGAGMRFYCLPLYLAPRGILALWGRGKNRATERETRAEGNETVMTAHSRNAELYRDSLLNGAQSLHILAKQRWVTNIKEKKTKADPNSANGAADAATSRRFAERTFLGVSVKLRFQADRATTEEINQAFIRPVNQALGSALEEFPPSAQIDIKRQISLGRVYTAGDISRLRALGEGFNQPRGAAAAETLNRVAAAVPIKLSMLKAFVDGLHADSVKYVRVSDRLYHQSERLEAFLEDNMVQGMGAIERLLPSNIPLTQETSSELYTDPISRASNFILLHGAKGVHPRMTRKQIRSFYEDAEKNLKGLLLGGRVLDLDSLLTDPEERYAIAMRFQELDKQIRRIISRQHLSESDGQQICAKIKGAWWQKSIDARILSYMSDDIVEIGQSAAVVDRLEKAATTGTKAGLLKDYLTAEKRLRQREIALERDLLRRPARRDFDRRAVRTAREDLAAALQRCLEQIGMMTLFMQAFGWFWWLFAAQRSLRDQVRTATIVGCSNKTQTTTSAISLVH